MIDTGIPFSTGESASILELDFFGRPACMESGKEGREEEDAGILKSKPRATNSEAGI